MSGLIRGALKGIGEAAAFLGKTGIASQLEREKAAADEARQMRILEAQQKFQSEQSAIESDRRLGAVTLQDQLAGVREDKKIQAQKDISEADNKSRERIAGMRVSAIGEGKYTGTQLQTLLNSSLKEMAAIDKQLKDAFGDERESLLARRKALEQDADIARDALKKSAKIGTADPDTKQSLGLIGSAMSKVNPRDNALQFLPGDVGATYRQGVGQMGSGGDASAAPQVLDANDYFKRPK